jgi:GT2 family glycosyltransferase
VPKLVAAVLLNLNRWGDTITCLESVLRSELSVRWIVVCDNGSTDGSLERIRDWAAGRVSPVYDRGPGRDLAWPPAAKPIPCRGPGSGAGAACSLQELVLIDNLANLGFAAGSNVGIRWALGAGCDFVWLLNNDTVVAPRTLSALIAGAERDSRAGAVGSVQLDYSRPGRVQMVGGRVFPALGSSRKLGKGMAATEAAACRVRDLEFVSGCSVLLGCAALRDVGLLDESYFVYWEDADWCVRARRSGYRVLCAPDSQIWHREGASSGLRSATQYALDMEGALLFVSRHYPLRLPLAVVLKPMVNVYSALKNGASPVAAVAGSWLGFCRLAARRKWRSAARR